MIATLQKDSIVTIRNRRLNVEELNMTTGQIRLVDGMGRAWIKTISEFTELYLSKELKLKPNERDMHVCAESSRRSLERMLTQKEIDEAQRRLGYVMSILDEQGSKIKSSVERVRRLKQHAVSIGEKVAMSDRNVTRLYSNWHANGRVIDHLVPMYRNCGNRTERLKTLVCDLIEETIQNEYMSETRPTVQKIVNLINERIRREAKYLDCTEVARSTVQRRIDAIPAYDKCVAREGFFAAQRKFPHGSKVVEPCYLNQEAELDHTPLDVEVLCPDTGEVIGRVWLTLEVERKAGLIRGYYLSPNAPSARSVIETVKCAALPKDHILQRYDETKDSEWPCWGQVTTLVVDNGPDLHSKLVLNGMTNLGITVQYNPKGNPRYKGKVERVLGVLNEEITEIMPGRTFSNYVVKGDYKSKKNAILTLDDLEKILVIWIVRDFHQRKVRQTKMSRLEKWKQHEMEIPAIGLPPTAEDFDKLLWKKDSRTLGYKGVEINCRYYNSVELQNIAKLKNHGCKVDVYTDETDISIIRVNIPGTEDVIDVGLADSEYARLNLSLDDHEQAIELARKRNPSIKRPGKLSEAMLMSAWNEIIRIREEAAVSKKVRNREAESKRRIKSIAKKGDGTQKNSKERHREIESVSLIPNPEDV